MKRIHSKLFSGRSFSGMAEVAGPIYAGRSTKGGKINYDTLIDDAFNLPKNIQKQLKSESNPEAVRVFSGISELCDCILNLNDLGHGNITLNVAIDPAFGVDQNMLKGVKNLMYNLDLGKNSRTHI